MNKRIFDFSFVLMMVILCSCQSNSIKKSESNNVKAKPVENKSYIVKDANLVLEPDWINHSKSWGSSNDPDHMSNIYFFSQSEPKQNRTTACEVSKFNSMIEIKNTIIEKYRPYFLNQANRSESFEKDWQKIELIIDQRVNTILKATEVARVYWEYREYQKNLGAIEDFKAYSCMTLVKIPKNVLIKIIKDTSVAVFNSKENKEAFKVSHDLFTEIEQSILRAFSF